MTDELTQLEHWAAPLIAKLSPQGRRLLARTIAADLRRSQAKRIAAQQEPDGQAFAARKSPPTLRGRKGKIRKRQAAMFKKLRTARYLKIDANANEISVGFKGRAARIARVHQEGLDDKPSPNARMVRYARRQLLGFSAEDREMVRNRLLEHLAN